MKKRSECTCPCHTKPMIHCFPCCTPDDVLQMRGDSMPPPMSTDPKDFERWSRGEAFITKISGTGLGGTDIPVRIIDIELR